MNKPSREGKEMYAKKVIQFGEGNFLRGFIDVMFQEMNESSDLDAGIVVVQPIPFGRLKELEEQEGVYHAILNERKEGGIITSIIRVDSISGTVNPYEDYEEYLMLGEIPDVRFIFSNTTEAGIAYLETDFDEKSPQSFPAKVTHLLLRRYEKFGNEAGKGLHLIPCELIDKNGEKLKEIILKHCEDWKLGSGFKQWIEQSCHFHNTLVDRIVSGFPAKKAEKLQQQIGLNDELLVEAESYGLLVIQGHKSLQEELPVKDSNIEVVFTDDITPYRQRKVRILNGAHTCLVPVAFFLGVKYVHELFEREDLLTFVKSAIYDEIIPTITMSRDELTSYADDVLNRFRNESLNHAIASIALNSISKFKVRVLPSMLDFYLRDKQLPKHLVYSFAALLCYYKGEFNGKKIELKDDQMILDMANKIWTEFDSIEEVVSSWLGAKDIWGLDLNTIVGLKSQIVKYASDILSGDIDLRKI